MKTEQTYKKIYNTVLHRRENLLRENKRLLNQGEKDICRDNCLILDGMARVIELLPRP